MSKLCQSNTKEGFREAQDGASEVMVEMSCLATETVEGTALALESVDNVEGGNGLALGMLGVGDGVTNDTLKEGLENTAGLLVDHWGALLVVLKRKGSKTGLHTGRNTLDTTTTRETTDSWLGNTLDVVTENLAMTLGSSLIILLVYIYKLVVLLP